MSTDGKPPAKPRLVALSENGRRIGEGHPQAKFSDEEIELIRQLAEGGDRYPPMGLSEIARKFETSRGVIHDIVNYRRRASTVARWKLIRREVKRDRGN